MNIQQLPHYLAQDNRLQRPSLNPTQPSARNKGRTGKKRKEKPEIISTKAKTKKRVKTTLKKKEKEKP